MNNTWRKYRVLSFLVLLGLTSCFIFNKTTKEPEAFNYEKLKDKKVLIITPYGNMKVKLYDETPKHKRNFLKLVYEQFYDSLLFHRVINQFMIQGGDPESKNAPARKTLGNGGPGYTVPAEFTTKYYHKKGALSAARQGDNVNPEKRSSGSQFYIVQGRPIRKSQIKQFEDNINKGRLNNEVLKYIMAPENKALKHELDSLKKTRNVTKLGEIYRDVQEKVQEKIKDMPPFKYTDEQVEIYTTIGGTPHLDGSYTVFGEVVEGLNVIDSIAKVKTDRNNRPNEDIIMQMKLVD